MNNVTLTSGCSETSPTEDRLSATNITVVKETRTLLSDINLRMSRGELIGLVGPNGAGKSTLLSVLAGLDSPNSGQVLIDSKPLSTLTANERARKMALLEQLTEIHWPVTVERLVALGRLPHLQGWQSLGETDSQAVHDALTQTDCIHLKDRPVNKLSGGEKSLVLLARVLATQPSILLADEPIAALDLGHQLQTMELLRQFSSGNAACIAVLHDLSLAARFCDRIVLLQDGQVIADAVPEKVLTQENLARAYGVDVISGFDPVPWMVPLQRL